MRSSIQVTTSRTTSRTGSCPGRAGDRPARQRRFDRRRAVRTGRAGPVDDAVRTTRPGTSRAFTVIELVVVVGIVAILAAILIPVLGAARTSARKKQAQKEVSDIKGAITQYYIDRHEYPPDTANWQDLGDLFDARSLHRYLGRTIEGEKGRTFGPYLNVRRGRLRDVEDEVGIYTDPWGKDYHMDAVHTQMIGETPTRVGAPHRVDSGEGSGGSTVSAVQRALDFKIVSFGPDGEAGLYYPFDPDLSNAETARIAADDIRSW